MFGAFSKLLRTPTKARSFSIRGSLGPFATRDQDMPKEQENTPLVMSKKEAAVADLNSKIEKHNFAVQNGWKKWEELMWKAEDTKLSDEEKVAIYKEAEMLEESAKKAEEKRDALKNVLTMMEEEDGGDDKAEGNGDSDGDGDDGGDGNGDGDDGGDGNGDCN